MNTNPQIHDMGEVLLLAARRQVLKKAVLSKPDDKSIIRAVITPRLISGKNYLQAEFFSSDNKAMHRNIPQDVDCSEICDILSAFSQINLITTVGEGELKRSKSGKITLIGVSALQKKICGATESDTVPAESNNKEKNYIIPSDAPFLHHLGVSDKNGRVYDKKQSKFRQINKFAENVRDIYEHLPSSGSLVVYDLCCGKSYLSFAVYHYLKNIMGREVRMYGVDLKADVIDYCNGVAREVGFDGLSFCCEDIKKYVCREKPDLVISLHACDIATDIVLEKAVAEGARVILSTPCCHHELNHKIKCPELSFITEYSMLRQKLCDAATDALRIKMLEANNYSCAALELIDPEETPKNILIRAILRPATPANLKRADAAALEYERAKKFLLGADDAI